MISSAFHSHNALRPQALTFRETPVVEFFKYCDEQVRMFVYFNAGRTEVDCVVLEVCGGCL
jgi:hypothetical protein